MRRRAMGVAGLAIVFGVMLVCFGATAGVAERCKPDEHGGHGPHGHGRLPRPHGPDHRARHRPGDNARDDTADDAA